MGELREAGADLVLGVRCAGCDTPGVTLCTGCRTAIRPRPRLAWPDPVPAALLRPQPVPPVAAVAYDDVMRTVILAYKERGYHALLGPLGEILARVVRELAPVTGKRVWLVPIPSRRAAVRERGYDAIADLAVRAAALTRRAGVDARVARCLRLRMPVRDQAGLDAQARKLNLYGAFGTTYVPDGSRAIVVVDDVVTTGATIAAAIEALRAAGRVPVAAATLAATARQIWLPRENLRSGLPSVPCE